jgi:aladin
VIHIGLGGFPYENHPLPKALSIPESAKIRGFAWHLYKPQLALGLQNDTVAIYQIDESSQRGLELTHEFQHDIRCLAWKPYGGNILAVGCKAGVVVWDGDWVTRYLQTPSAANICSIQWSPTEPLLAVGCPHESLIVWNVATGVPTRLHSMSLPSSYLLRWSPDGQFLFQASL